MGGDSSNIRDLGFMPRPLYPREKSPRYLLDRRLGALGGPQSRYGPCEEKNIFCPRLESNLGRPATSPSLYRLTYPGSTLHTVEPFKATQEGRPG
jgi:hypothetical protein